MAKARTVVTKVGVAVKHSILETTLAAVICGVAQLVEHQPGAWCKQVPGGCSYLCGVKVGKKWTTAAMTAPLMAAIAACCTTCTRASNLESETSGSMLVSTAATQCLGAATFPSRLACRSWTRFTLCDSCQRRDGPASKFSKNYYSFTTVYSFQEEYSPSRSFHFSW